MEMRLKQNSNVIYDKIKFNSQTKENSQIK